MVALAMPKWTTVLRIAFAALSVWLSIYCFTMGAINLSDTLAWHSARLPAVDGIELTPAHDARLLLLWGWANLGIAVFLADPEGLDLVRAIVKRGSLVAYSSLVASLVLIGFLVGLIAEPEINDYFSARKTDETFQSLLKNRYAFEGKLVTLQGFAVFRFESNSLWLSETAYHRGHRSKVIWLDVDSPHGIQNDLDNFSNRIVRVTGTFSRNTSGHGGLYLGGLSEIKELVLAKEELAKSAQQQDSQSAEFSNLAQSAKPSKPALADQ